MGKKKSATKITGKTVGKTSATNGDLPNQVDKPRSRSRTAISNESLRKLAKNNRPPIEYFQGDMERPW